MRSGLILLVATLSACGLSPERMRQADAVVAETRGEIDLGSPRASHSLSTPLDALPVDGHHVVVLEHGDDALAMRIHLIRSADERIELMSYIFYDDESGRLLLAELLDAARRGVRVRVLVDALFSLEDEALLASLALAHENFELRFYNPLFDRATLNNPGFFGATLCCYRTLNHRMHHKMVAIDGRHALVGGRNTAARYFDLDTRMNFLDIEAVVSGPVVAEMLADFDRFWRHELTRRLQHTREVADRLIERPPTGLELGRSERTRFAVVQAADPGWIEALIEHAGQAVDTVSYFADPPGRTWERGEDQSTGILHGLIGSARERVVIQTPYLVLSPELERTLKRLDDGVEIIVVTNSLAATDAYPVYAISRRQRFRMVERLGIELYEIRPYPADLERLIRRYRQLIADKAAGIARPMRGDPAPPTSDRPGPRVSLHTKLLIVDNEVVALTSHNFDPRSQYYNTENGVIIRDGELARSLFASSQRLMEPRNSWRSAVRPRGPPVFGSINRGMARLFRRLPTLDVWPWYRTELYALPESAGDIPVDDPAFYEVAEPKGQSPEVANVHRRFMTEFIARLFGFLRPVM